MKFINIIIRANASSVKSFKFSNAKVTFAFPILQYELQYIVELHDFTLNLSHSRISIRRTLPLQVYEYN